jgi:hypothetical protein
MLAVVAEGWVTEVVSQTSDFDQIHVDLAAPPQKLLCGVKTNRYGLRYLSYFERMSKSIPKKV